MIGVRFSLTQLLFCSPIGGIRHEETNNRKNEMPHSVLIAQAKRIQPTI
jgi:hypothetical protein